MSHAFSALSQAWAFWPHVAFQHVSSHAWSLQLAEHVQYVAAGVFAAHWSMHACGVAGGVVAGGVVAGGVVAGGVVAGGVVAGGVLLPLVFVVFFAGTLPVCSPAIAFGSVVSSPLRVWGVGAAQPVIPMVDKARSEAARS